MKEKEWVLAYILPNISIQESYETKYVALVPYTDPRLSDIRIKFTSASTLLDGFTDDSGRMLKPAAIIIASDAPKKIWRIEPIVAFRNIVALSVVLKSLANLRSSSTFFGPVFSDHFDIYPVTISQNDRLVSKTPALNNMWGKNAPFRGMTSPYIPRSFSMIVIADNTLMKAMLAVWEMRFVTPAKDDYYSRVLFRSLEMAYHATATPVKNQTTIHDYGVTMALWVSACEILAHPEEKNVNLQTVLDQLGKYEWHNRKLKGKWFKFKNQKKLNFIQRIYKDLYNSRNAFLHGNPVNKSLLYPCRSKKLPPLSILAPIIYRTLVFVYLKKYIDLKESKDVYDKLLAFSFNELDYEECLLQIVCEDPDID